MRERCVSWVVRIFLFLDVLLLLATVLPLMPTPAWWSRAGEFPRLQIAAILLVVVLLQFLLLPRAPAYWLMLAVPIACLAWQVFWILPYTPLFPCEVRRGSRDANDQRALSVLVANVLMSNRRWESLRERIEAVDPDIVLLLETDAWWEDRMRYLRSSHPHGLDCPLDNRYGMHLYSRLTVENAVIEFLVEEDVPSMHMTVVLRSGEQVRFRALHPTPPAPTENPTSRERDAELLVVARAVAKDPARVIVTGDFNDVAWSPTTRLFRKVSRLLDPRIGRGMFSTFHAALPFLRWPLDHVFHSDDFTLLQMEVLPRFGSDHLPIHYRLQYEPAVKPLQEAPAPDADDHAEAVEKTRAGGASPADVPRARVSVAVQR